MKTYFSDVAVILPQLISRFSKEEALILSSLINISAQQRSIALAYNIPHSSFRLGWIIDPVTILHRIDPQLEERSIKSLIKKLVKSKIIFVNDNPYAILIDAEHCSEEYGLAVTSRNIPEPVPTDWDTLSQQEFWDKIPGISDNLPRISLDDYVKKAQSTADWAKQYRILDNAPEFILDASKMISDMSGYLPESKDWIAAVHLLYSTANNNLSVLRQGLIKGNEMRKNVPFSSIRSYLGSIREVAATSRIKVNGSVTKERITV